MPCPCKYTVVENDTLNKIAGKLGTTAADLVARNPGLDPAKIYIGQELLVPCSSASSGSGSTRKLLL